MGRIFTPFFGLFLLLFSVCFQGNIFAQCSTVEVSFNPPPVNNSFDGGQTIEMCFDVVYSGANANWLSAVVIDLPPGIPESSITGFTVSSADASLNASNWGMFSDVTDYGSNNIFDWGFFYDQDGDGNPCNDWGNSGLENSVVTFCVSVTLDCGPSGAYDASSLVPNAVSLGDYHCGDWTSPPTTCETTPEPSSTPYSSDIVLNCCDAEAGLSPGTVLICGTTPYNLFDELTGNPDNTGSWTDPNGNTLPGGYLGTFDPVTDPEGPYTYSVTGSDGCVNTSVVDMAFNDWGVIANITYCSNASFNIFTQIPTGPYSPLPQTGNWTDPNGNALGSPPIIDPNTGSSGTYTYTYTTAAGCPSTAQVYLALADAICPGVETWITVCSLDQAFTLLDSMQNCGPNEPVEGGNWLEYDEAGNFINFYPGNYVYNPADHASGYFTYGLGVGSCFIQSDIHITVNTPPDLGDPLTTTNICSTDPPLNLETLITGGAESGHTWTDINGNVIPMPFDPSTYPAGGPYIFIYSGGAENCEVTSLLELTIIDNTAFAGEDNTISLCPSQGSFIMTDSLLSGPNGEQPQSGGVWSGPSFIYNNQFNPLVNTSGTYTYDLVTNCGTDQATLTVNVTSVPSPGNNAIESVCSNIAQIDLFTLLNGNPASGGTWTDPSGQSMTSGLIDPDTALTGLYTYTQGTPACNLSATVDLSYSTAMTAGTDGYATICENATQIDLDDYLGLGPGGVPPSPGTWLTPDGNNVLVDGIYTPGDPNSPPGVYTHFVADPLCGMSSATVTVTELPLITVGTVSENCAADASSYTVSFPISGGDPGSYQVLPASSGSISGGIFQSNSIPSGTAYNFTVSDANGCNSVPVTGSVTCACDVTATLSGTSTICAGDAADLNVIFNGTPPFDLVYTDGTTNFTENGIAANSYNISVSPTATSTYSLVSVTGVCAGTVSGSATVTVNQPPSAGTDATVSICENASPIDLFINLGGNPTAGGTWSPPLSGNMYDPAVNTPGAYVYTVTGGGVCPDASATVTVTELPLITVGTVSENCAADASSYTVSFPISGGDPGSYQVSPASSGSISGGIFESNSIPSGTPYNFTVSDANGCNSVPVTGSVTCACDVTATLSGTSTICAGDAADLNVIFNGTPPFDLVYTDGTTNFTENGIAANSYNISVSPTATSTYSLVSVTGVCAGTVSGSATVTVNQPPSAGTDATVSICENASPIDLFINLGGSPTAGGTWSPPLSGNMYDPAVNTPGAYVYTVTGGGVCPDASATVTVTELPLITVGTVSENCAADASSYTVSFPISGGDPGSYQVSPASSGSITGGIFESNSIPAGTPYNFTVSDANGCNSEVVSGSVNCNCDVTATLSGTSTICTGDAVDLNVIFNGTPPFDLVYTDGTTNFTENGIAANSYNISVSPTATSTYSLVSVTGVCAGTVSGSATVTVNQPPSAGTDATVSICENASPIDLFINLGGNPTAGGTWSPPLSGNMYDPAVNTPGAYVYTVTGGGVCPDASATVTVTELPLITVGTVSENCAADASSYTVSFPISGGDPGSYQVLPASSGSITGGTFQSNSIPAGTPYNFTVSDANGCNSEVVSGSVNCNCDVTATLSGTSTICAGDAADLNVIFNGTPPFDLVYTDGTTNFTENGIAANSYNISVSPTATSTYSLVSVTGECAGTVSGSATVTVNGSPVVSNITTVCDATGENYTLSFTISGGTPGTYQVLPAGSGVLTGNTFSVTLPAGTAYNFTVQDANACTVTPVTGSYNCGCVSDAGTMPSGLVEFCLGETPEILPPYDYTTDGNDVVAYVLYEGTATTISNIISWSTGVIFTELEGLVQPEQTYYIARVVGNPAGTEVDMLHACTSISNGTPIMLHETPSAVISGYAAVCEQETAQFTIDFTGPGPWTYVYAINGQNQAAQTSTSASTTITAGTSGTYSLISVSNDHCTGSVSGTAQLVVNSLPTAVLTGPSVICENSGESLNVEMGGDGPYTFTYSINGTEQEPVTTSYSVYSIPVTEPGTYELTSISNENCSGTPEGSVDVSISPQPTASIAGGDEVCSGEAADFDITLTGNAPWTVQYAIDGVPQPPLQSDVPTVSFESTTGGSYTIYSISDATCTGYSTGTAASLLVNPAPSVTLTPSLNAVCPEQEVSIDMDIAGTAPFTITYSVNGVETTLTGVGNNHTLNFTPEQTLLINVVSIEDNSASGCVSQDTATTFVDVSELPNAPVLEDMIVCSSDLPVHIGVPAAPGLTYTWNPGINLSSTEVANPQLTNISMSQSDGRSPQNFEYTVTASNGFCESSSTATITIDPGPVVQFGFTPENPTTEDPAVQFINNSYNMFGSEMAYQWEFGTLEVTDEPAPYYVFPEGTARGYYVTLTAINLETMCISELTKVVKIDPEVLLYVPSAFTPDEDGLNDLFFPVMQNIDKSEYKLQVFNRLGQLVFETEDVDGKWNGTMIDSEYLAEPGVYVWLIQTKNKENLKDISRTGTVTLIR